MNTLWKSFSMQWGHFRWGQKWFQQIRQFFILKILEASKHSYKNKLSIVAANNLFKKYVEELVLYVKSKDDN